MQATVFAAFATGGAHSVIDIGFGHGVTPVFRKNLGAVSGAAGHEIVGVFEPRCVFDVGKPAVDIRPVGAHKAKRLWIITDSPQVEMSAFAQGPRAIRSSCGPQGELSSAWLGCLSAGLAIIADDLLADRFVFGQEVHQETRHRAGIGGQFVVVPEHPAQDFAAFGGIDTAKFTGLFADIVLNYSQIVSV